MKFINTLIPAAALIALAGAPALAETTPANVTTADAITCIPERMARCKSESECSWTTASEQAKEQILVVDFKAKTASFMHKGKKRGGGVVFDDKFEGEARSFVISKDATRPSHSTMKMTVDKAGKLTGSRNAGKIKIEAACKTS